MISHYTLFDISKLSKYFDIPQGVPKGVKASYNITPTNAAPVIVTRDGVRTFELMKWGLVAKDAKNMNSVFRYKTYNIASENIFSRHSWEKAVSERRCLVPANGFFELNESGKKRAFYVQPTDGELWAYAGVYTSWEDPDGTTKGTFAIITIEPEHDFEVPGYRIPVIIKPEDQARWLDPTIGDMPSLYGMLYHYPVDLMTGEEVVPAVHSPKANGPAVIEKL